MKKSHTSDLTAYLKALEQKGDSPWRTTWHEIIKLRTEINKIEIKNQYKESMKQKTDSLRKLSRETNCYPY